MSCTARDVAAFDDDVDGVVVAGQDRPKVRALGVTRQLRSRRMASESTESARCALSLRHEDDRVQPDAIAHWNHHVAPLVVEAVS